MIVSIMLSTAETEHKTDNSVESAKIPILYRRTGVHALAQPDTIRASLNAGQTLITVVRTTLKETHVQSVLSDITRQMETVIKMFHIVQLMTLMEMTAQPARLLMTFTVLKNA